MPWNPHLTVAALIEREGRFLFVEERIDGRLVLNQPAGHVEDAESLSAAVIRETLEETGWEFQPEFLIGLYRWRHPGSAETFFRVCFSGSACRHHPERPLDTDIVRTVWLSGDELTRQPERQRSPLVQRCVLDYLAGRRFPLELLQEVDGS